MENIIEVASVLSYVPVSIKVKFPLPAKLASKAISINKQLVAEAKSRLANHNCMHPQLVPLLDASILIIEDDQGVLWHHEGDLSFLMATLPVTGRLFAKQLSTEIQENYLEHQQAVWNYEVKDGDPFISPNGRQAAIFPIFVLGSRFTVTVFFTGVGPDLL